MKLRVFFFLTADTQGKVFQIIHVDRLSTIQWKIPCFPILTMEFARVHFKQGSEIGDGFIQKAVAADLNQGEYLCTSHCHIEMEGKRYTVLWKLQPKDRAVQLPFVQQSATDDHISDVYDESNEEDESDESEVAHDSCISTRHCLPFKVLGTCHSPDRQKAIEESYEHLCEHNRPLFVNLKAEPDNLYDQNAIAVFIMASSEYKKVGYIARELTKFVHPLLSDPSLEVSVNKIRFSTTFLMIGFYLTIDITRKRQWSKLVPKLSKILINANVSCFCKTTFSPPFRCKITVLYFNIKDMIGQELNIITFRREQKAFISYK